MKTNEALKTILEEKAKTIQDLGVLGVAGKPDSEVLASVLMHEDVNLVIHGLQRGRFYLFHNDRAKGFYGFDENDNTRMNISFYLKVMHPTTYHQLIQSQQFFIRDDRGYMETNFLLRNSEGNYEKVTGVTKTIVWSDDGKALYALEASVQTENLGYLNVLTKCESGKLSLKQKECLALIVRGYGNSEIAEEMGLSVKTVEKHVGAILRACNVSSRTQLLSSC